MTKYRVFIVRLPGTAPTELAAVSQSFRVPNANVPVKQIGAFENDIGTGAGAHRGSVVDFVNSPVSKSPPAKATSVDMRSFASSPSSIPSADRPNAVVQHA